MSIFPLMLIAAAAQTNVSLREKDTTQKTTWAAFFRAFQMLYQL